MTETECPGWTVQDNLAHIIGIESTILGRPDPEHEPRGRPAREERRRRRQRGLGRLVPVDDRVPTCSPTSAPSPASGSRSSARRTTTSAPRRGRPSVPAPSATSSRSASSTAGSTSRTCAGRSPPRRRRLAAATLSLDRIEAVMPMVVGKKVAPPDGTVVVFAVAGPVGPSVRDRGGGRSRRVPRLRPRRADGRTSTMDTDTFVRLASGRGDPESILASRCRHRRRRPGARRAVAEQMNFLF